MYQELTPIICPECGLRFQPRSHNTIYCTQRCSNRVQRRRRRMSAPLPPTSGYDVTRVGGGQPPLEPPSAVPSSDETAGTLADLGFGTHSSDRISDRKDH